jgi:quinohemoprotein ethanol dehydrogenase
MSKILSRKIVVLFSSALAMTLAAWVASGQQPRRVDDAALRNAGKTGEEWLTYGLNQAESRYSPLNQINAGNVNRLGLTWSYEIGPGGGNQEGTPLFANGVLYSITNWSIVFAVDARTGKEKWRWDPDVNQPAVRPKVCCGIVNRGVAIYNGKIIAPINDGRLVALDAETGKPVWESRVAYTQDNYSLTMAPRIAKGKVIIGVAGAEYPVRGFFSAFDANTGQFAWKFYTVPGDPSKPFENEAMRKAAATWDPGGWMYGGGGTVWDGMAYDPEADLFYVGTGNAGPWPEEIRKQSKGKENLFAASIIAVKPDTGEYKWHFQLVPGDEWDYDSVQQLILADVTIKGQKRKVIMQANKNGFYYVIDRVTGQFITGQPFAQVTWAKGLNEETGKPIVNPEAYYGAQSITISPGPGGAHNWAPMSFNPNTGLVYIPASVSGGGGYAVDQNFTYKPGQSNIGLAFGRGRGAAAPTGDAANAALPQTAPAKPLPPPPAIGPTPPEGGGRGGFLVAWDVATQKERWRAAGGGSIGGGTVTTAGNLVFQVVPDGRLMAYSADKGEKLLEVQTGLRGGMGPPITYQLDGKQYVALAGGSGAFPAFGPPPGAAAPGAAPPGAPAAGPGAAPAGGPGLGGPFGAGGPPPPPVKPKLLVFVLDGKAPLPVSAPQP